MKILYLTLKGKWYDMIASGEKPEEYREMKSFWVSRLVKSINYKSNFHGQPVPELLFKHFDVVCFARGGHFGPSLPQMTIELKQIGIGTGKPEWGAEPGKEYFVIKLGEIIKRPCRGTQAEH